MFLSVLCHKSTAKYFQGRFSRGGEELRDKSRRKCEGIQSSDCSLWQSLLGEDTVTFVLKLLTAVIFSVKFKFTTAATLGNRVFVAATGFIFNKIRFQGYYVVKKKH